ncbi:ubiquitin-like domain-containing protein [Thermopolyspora sp. NPDC052614]|uniref:ubiquitin-like domain-containing protein n=1 Tax=Thermopolyspora sp. NPDC052614 TaxID=3155682 RepID=UPI00341DF576
MIGVASALFGGVSLGLIVAFGVAREVHLMVDGEPIALRTFAGTVGEALAAAEVRYGPDDHVSPPPATAIEDAGQIVVRHARPLTLIKDGRTMVRRVTALNVRDALKELDLDHSRARLSASVMRQIPVTGFRLKITTMRRIVIVKDGRRTPVITTARTVREALARRGITLAAGERVRPRLSAFPRDGQVVRIIPAPPPRTEPITPAVARLNWAALAACETGGDPRAYNPTGPYYGMYQISLPMWRAVGGLKRPSDWSADEQTYRAQLLYQRVEGRWRRQWPGCGARLFG